VHDFGVRDLQFESEQFNQAWNVESEQAKIASDLISPPGGPEADRRRQPGGDHHLAPRMAVCVLGVHRRRNAPDRGFELSDLADLIPQF
jgi:hypothetical protein